MSGGEAELLEALAKEFQLGRPIRALEVVARGQKNSLGLCQLKTDRGCFAVKRLEEEPRTLALTIETAALKAGLPLPEPMHTRDGELIASYQAGHRKHWIRVYRWVQGKVLPWGCAEPDVSFEIGKLMASMHNLVVPTKALQEDPATQWSAITESGWTQLAERADARRLTWAQDLRDAIPHLVNQETCLAKCRAGNERRVPSQRDLHPPNIVRTPTSEFFVVDWDSAGPVVARYDVAKYALVWATPEGGAPLPGAVHAFIDGYRDSGGEYRSQGPSDLLYRQQTLHWWLLFNIRRDLGAQPGPDPDLTAALLRRAVSWDVAGLEPLAALLDC